MERSAGGWSATLELGDERVDAGPVTATDGNTRVSFDGLRIVFDVAPDVGQAMKVHVRGTGELVDPELRVLRDAHPLPRANEEPDFFTSTLLTEMASFVPAVHGALQKHDDQRSDDELVTDWTKLDESARNVVRRNYHLYLLTKQHTRQLLLDTNNLVVDVEMGTTPILEDFKRLHRGIDVLKELEESVKRRLENERRIARLKRGELSDPDIESAVRISVPQPPTTVVTPALVSAPPKA